MSFLHIFSVKICTKIKLVCHEIGSDCAGSDLTNVCEKSYVKKIFICIFIQTKLKVFPLKHFQRVFILKKHHFGHKTSPQKAEQEA